jgi:Flp pilus assembly pilin Flp
MGAVGAWSVNVAGLTCPAVVVGVGVWAVVSRRRGRQVRHDAGRVVRRPVWAGVPRQRDRGSSAVEYGLLVAAISLVVMGVLFTLGQVVKSDLGDTGSHLQACVTDPGAVDCTGPTSTSTTSDSTESADTAGG